jgi:hypothetical protein
LLNNGFVPRLLTANVHALAMWRHSVFRPPVPMLIKDTKVEMLFVARHIANAMLAETIKGPG